MRLDDIAFKGFKQNRSVKYEKPVKSDSHEAQYHYPSGNGSVSKIQTSPEGKTVKGEQPLNTREYHYQSGPGSISPIRKQSKYIVGGRTERLRDKLEVDQETKNGIITKINWSRLKDENPTATGERRDFNREFNSDKNMVGSIANAGKPQKEYSRFIRPAQRLSNQKISIDRIEKTQDGKREYHHPSGKGKETDLTAHPIGKMDRREIRGYEYPSGKGDTSPVVGKILPGRSSRRAQGISQLTSKLNGGLKVGKEQKGSYSEKGSYDHPSR